MPFKGRQDITFPEDRSKNIVLIFGDNMRGKTSLLNSLRWAFYGKAVDRYGAEIPLHKLVNIDSAAEGDWEIEVNVTFTHFDRSYELVRHASRHKAVGTPQKPEDFVVQSTLRQDGEYVRGDKVQHLINQIVPEQISRFFLFDGELLQEYEALLADESEQGKKIKEAIEQVLGVPSLVQGKEDLRVLRKPFDKQMAMDLRQNQQVKHFTEKLSDLTRSAEEIEESRDQLAQALDNTRRQYQELQQQVDSAEALFLQRQELNQHLESKQRLTEEMQQLEVRRLEAVKEAWRDLLRPNLERKLADLQERISSDTTAIRETSERTQINALITASLEKGECALCEVPLAAQTVDKMQDVSESRQESTDISKLTLRLADSNALARKIGQIRYPQARSIIAQIDSSALRLAVEETRIATEITRLKEELSSFDNDQMVRTRRAAENAHHALRQLETKLEEASRSLEENRSEQEKLRLVINQNQNARDQRSSRIVALIASIERIFGGAISKLRDDLRSDIEMKATTAFKSLTTDKSYSSLKINNNYGLTIIDEQGREVSLRSAGAEQIVALSLIDALNQTGRSPGPIIMDTPFGRLDPKHRDNVLKHLPVSAPQVVLFVHEGEVDQERDLSEIHPKIGGMYYLERITSSQTRLVRQ